MSYLILTTVILFLYLRTYKYNWNIDDHVPRSGMYVTVPPPQVPIINGVRFDEMRRSKLAVFTNIGTYILVCSLINYMWGFKVAMLYAVMPTNVSGIAWGRTGNYYTSTCFLVLTAYYFLTTFTWGIVPACAFFYVGLESTISALPLMVIGLLSPYGWILAVPLVKFLSSKRFVDGLKKRKKGHEDKGMMSCEISWRNPIVVIEIMVYYVLLGTGFMPLGFFHTYGRTGKLRRINGFFFLSLALLVVFCYFGYIYSPFGLFWWLMFIGLFCHVIPNLGQFVTERYMYIANIGLCMILCSFFEQLPQVYWFLVGVWFMISLRYIPAWRNNEALYSHGIVSFPDCGDNYVNYASFLLDKGKALEAVRPLQCAIKYTIGRKSKLWGDLSKCYMTYKEWRQAIHCLNMALIDADLDQVEDIKGLIKELEEKK